MATKLLSLMMVATLLFSACSKEENGIEKKAPVIAWAINPSFDDVYISPNMAGKATILVKAETGIKSFNIEIDSPVLTEVALGSLGLSTNMDLINDAAVAAVLAGFKIPVGEELKDKIEVTFDIAALIPLIITLNPTLDGTHVFKLTVTDNNGKSSTKDLTFVYLQSA